MHENHAISQAAAALENADALLVTAGAGMGVDSGLPDFRGSEGFWNAYPAFRHLGLSFADLANPRWFSKDPALAWGFYGHRMNLYRATLPHPGFEILLRWSERLKRGAFVFTSNVDGHFQRAGFAAARVAEVHGSIHHAQCMQQCGAGVFSADGFVVTVDEQTFRCVGDLPSCPACGALARPNILMFGDYGWDPARSARQGNRLDEWLSSGTHRLAVIEMGAGTAIPTVRSFSESIAESMDGTLIRINLREPEVPAPGIQIPLRALEALRAIDAQFGAR